MEVAAPITEVASAPSETAVAPPKAELTPAQKEMVTGINTAWNQAISILNTEEASQARDVGHAVNPWLKQFKQIESDGLGQNPDHTYTLAQKGSDGGVIETRLDPLAATPDVIHALEIVPGDEAKNVAGILRDHFVATVTYPDGQSERMNYAVYQKKVGSLPSEATINYTLETMPPGVEEATGEESKASEKAAESQPLTPDKLDKLIEQLNIEDDIELMKALNRGDIKLADDEQVNKKLITEYLTQLYPGVEPERPEQISREDLLAMRYRQNAVVLQAYKNLKASYEPDSLESFNKTIDGMGKEQQQIIQALGVGHVPDVATLFTKGGMFESTSKQERLLGLMEFRQANMDWLKQQLEEIQDNMIMELNLGSLGKVRVTKLGLRSIAGKSVSGGILLMFILLTQGLTESG